MSALNIHKTQLTGPTHAPSGQSGYRRRHARGLFLSEDHQTSPLTSTRMNPCPERLLRGTKTIPRTLLTICNTGKWRLPPPLTNRLHLQHSI